jgi:hypothetical protein
MASEAVVVAATKHSGLAALTAAALALPGLVPEAEAAAGAAGTAASGLDSRYSRYEESGGRMRVEVYQAAAQARVTDRLSLRVNGVKDVMSGASPMAVVRGGDGKLGLVMSGASIRDERDAVDLSASYELDDATLGLDVGRSSENDYNSNFFNIDGRWNLNRKTTTLAAGYGFASDNVWAVSHLDGRTDRLPGVGGGKASHQGLLGVTQVLDKNSLLQLNLTYGDSAGFLSDPYKWVLVGNRLVEDNRPSQRRQFGVLLRYVRHFAALNEAALHLDYRFYSDSWDVDAHTFEASWHQPLAYGWQLVPNFRYYSQDSADFYAPIFEMARCNEPHHSSDYRLAGFGAVAGGVRLENEFFGRLRVAGGIEFYERRKDLGFSGGAGTAADNFSFSVFSFGLNLKF